MERIELERLPLSTDGFFLLRPEWVAFFPEGFSGLELVVHIFGGVVLRATSSLTTRPFLKSSRDRRKEVGTNRLVNSTPTYVVVAFTSRINDSPNFVFGGSGSAKG